jgi:HAMP domain-containing protein
MKSLFAKIVVWFLATLLIAGVALFATAAVGSSEQRSRPLPFQMLLTLQAARAQHAYETGGREELAATLQRFRSWGLPLAVLTDGGGRDPITGQDRSDLLRETRERWLPLGRSQMVLGRAAPNGRYWFFAPVPRQRWFAFFLHPQYLWVLSLSVLLCYGLALYLTLPLRRMQHAAERFGRGDFSARAGSSRQDELGELARTLDRMAERIETLLAAERRLLQDISHELRSPLARLSVAVELARSGENLDPALDRTQREADRLNTLLSGLLQVTRAEGDPATMRVEPLRLDELAAVIVADCSATPSAMRPRPPPWTSRSPFATPPRWCAFATAGPAGPAMPCRACSTPSTGWTPTAIAPAAVWGSGWPLRAGRSNCIAARFARETPRRDWKSRSNRRPADATTPAANRRFSARSRSPTSARIRIRLRPW